MYANYLNLYELFENCYTLRIRCNKPKSRFILSLKFLHLFRRIVDTLYPTKITFAKGLISNSLAMNVCVPIKCCLNFGTQNTSFCGLLLQEPLLIFFLIQERSVVLCPFLSKLIYPNTDVYMTLKFRSFISTFY